MIVDHQSPNSRIAQITLESFERCGTEPASITLCQHMKYPVIYGLWITNHTITIPSYISIMIIIWVGNHLAGIIFQVAKHHQISKVQFCPPSKESVPGAVGESSKWSLRRFGPAPNWMIASKTRQQSDWMWVIFRVRNLQVINWLYIQLQLQRDWRIMR